MHLAFSDNVLKYAPWSMSKLSVANQCTLKFKLQYIDKHKEPPTANSAGRLGSAAHKALELALKGEEMHRALNRAVIDEKLTTTESDDLLAFVPNISDFLARYEKYKEKHPAKKEYIELKYGLTKAMKPTEFFAKDVFFRGVWDLGLLLEEGVTIIWDHKSGDPTPIEKYRDQLDAYRIAALQLNPSIEGTQTAIHFLKEKSIVWDPYISSDEIRDRLIPWFVEHLNSKSSGINNTPTPTKGFWCAWCGYKTSGKCPLFPTT